MYTFVLGFLCVGNFVFSQVSIDEADHLALFFSSRRVASTKLIVFMYVNRLSFIIKYC